jgi:hypothetical protein
MLSVRLIDRIRSPRATEGGTIAPLQCSRFAFGGLRIYEHGMEQF